MDPKINSQPNTHNLSNKRRLNDKSTCASKPSNCHCYIISCARHFGKNFVQNIRNLHGNIRLAFLCLLSISKKKKNTQRGEKNNDWKHYIEQHQKHETEIPQFCASIVQKVRHFYHSITKNCLLSCQKMKFVKCYLCFDKRSFLVFSRHFFVSSPQPLAYFFTLSLDACFISLATSESVESRENECTSSIST